jgi:hypothetical protein
MVFHTWCKPGGAILHLLHMNLLVPWSYQSTPAETPHRGQICDWSLLHQLDLAEETENKIKKNRFFECYQIISATRKLLHLKFSPVIYLEDNASNHVVSRDGYDKASADAQ